MSRLRSRIFTLLSSLLLVSLAACSSPFASPQSTTTITHNDGNAIVNSQPTPQTVPMPQTDTSCPTPGTARAAVMRPIALGSHQNLVYTYIDSSANHLRRYDMTTHEKTDIVAIPHPLYSSQISSDGKWLLFMNGDNIGDKYPHKVQLIRIDGQGLQTLYCFSNTDEAFAAFSPDMRSIALLYDTIDSEGTGTIVIQLLDIATGKLQTVFTTSDKQTFISGLSWLDKTHLYTTLIENGIGSMTTKLVLLDVTAKTGFQPIRDFTPTGQINGASYAYTPDGTKLFVASYNTSASSAPSAITAGSPISSTSSVIYKFDSNTWAKWVSTSSNNSLLLLVYVTTNSGTLSQQVWTINADGSGQKVLATISSQSGSLYKSDSYIGLNEGPIWSNISRDGNFYALNSGSQNTYAILIGSLSGGQTQTIASTSSGSVSTVGWITM